jgi:hypothetical protein
MSFFEEDYELPTVKMTLKTREGYSNNPKAPALRGFLAVSRQSLKDIEQHIDASDKDSVFLSVVLWSARDAKYVHEGFVELKAVTASTDDDAPLKGKVTRGELPSLEATARAVPQPTVDISGLPF